MISFELCTQIYRPLKQVFGFVTTPENDFQWQYGTLTSARISNGDMGMGTLFRAVSHFLGQRMENVFEVTRFEPNKLYAYKSLSGPMLSQILYFFEIKGARTEVRVSVQLDPGTYLAPTERMAEKRVKKQYKENLSLLKHLLETSQMERSPQLPVQERWPMDTE